jgi:putative redox protein
MGELSVRVDFSGGFSGRLSGSKGQAPVGSAEGGLSPYDMLLGALASCFYSNFLDIAGKKRLSYASARVEVSGEKRDEVPATLRWVRVRLTVSLADGAGGAGAASGALEKAYRDSAELAAKYCSIYQTISHVAKMETVLAFED